MLLLRAGQRQSIVDEAVRMVFRESVGRIACVIHGMRMSFGGPGHPSHHDRVIAGGTQLGGRERSAGIESRVGEGSGLRIHRRDGSRTSWVLVAVRSWVRKSSCLWQSSLFR